MNKISRFVIWICSKFTREEIEQIIKELTDILSTRDPAIKPKDDFKEKHPNYRNFYVDPNPPLTEMPDSRRKPPTKNYKILLKEYEAKHKKHLSPVKHRSGSLDVPKQVTCPYCKAPHKYIYFNDGKKRYQLLCKVCSHTFNLNRRFRKNAKTKYYCPHCHHALFTWKETEHATIYKCCNRKCPHRIDALKQISPQEKMIQVLFPNHFKINYQYREYHFTDEQIRHSEPQNTKINLFKIHNSENILGLILTFYVSFALSARKTALVLKMVFNINVSYQTVLNYAQAAAYHCHKFNMHHKETIDDISAGDETYIKIEGKYNYVFFFISAQKLSITAYHVADNRGTLPAVASMMEAIRTATTDQDITLITDGNPAYEDAKLFINMNLNKKFKHIKVIGLQNLDEESEEYRAFKQIIERLNRTYKHHVRPAAGFNSFNGAVSLTTLFVTHYNFLRPHMSLKYKIPIHIPDLDNITTIQGKWVKILSLAA